MLNQLYTLMSSQTCFLFLAVAPVVRKYFKTKSHCTPSIKLLLYSLDATTFSNVSRGIEVLESKAHTENTVAARIAIAVTEREHPSISSIIVIATTIEDRIARSDEIRVVQFNPYISF